MPSDAAMPAAEARASEIRRLGHAVVQIEAAAAEAVAEAVDENFVKAADLILSCTGRVICTGVGKSGLIARKFAASLASLGTPAHFLHATEAVHGDLGVVADGDVVVALSHSGTTAEVLAVLPPIRRLGVPVIAVTDEPRSPLGEAAEVVLRPGVQREADPLGLAPTASTTAALVLTDALAVAVSQVRGFGRADFMRTHPGGALGGGTHA